VSNFLAVATVTATLRSVLDGALAVDQPGAVGGAQITTQRPDGAGTTRPETGLNIYLYQVMPNAAWRNADLPTRQSNGRVVQRPQAALDLFYLLSFYGDESQLEPQRLLGVVTQTLHAQPVLARDQIVAAKGGQPFLSRSNLDQQIELVKFTPAALSLEELSKLWSVFFQVPYALSVVYQASVVLIESENTPQAALPVRERNLYVVPFRHPSVESVQELGANQPIVSSSMLVLRGRQLRGELTLVRVGGGEPLPPQTVSDTTITLPLPPGLRAGVQGVQVVHQVPMGTPEVPHLGIESNVAGFVLHPTITQVSLADPPLLTLEISPAVAPLQRVVLLLNQVTPQSEPPQTYAIMAGDEGREDVTNTVAFAVGEVAAGDYLVRVQVDGAMSALTVDSDPNSPTFNQYTGLRVTIA
jgi:hypothetical protein